VSDGPIPPIGPDDLKFVPEPSDFTGLVGNELGTLGTNQDGFEEIFNEAATLAAGASTVLESLDQDLADASFNLPEFDPAVPTNLMASLQPASDAADTALAQFNVDVPPDPTGSTPGPTPSTKPCEPGTIVDGLTIGKPDPHPYTPLPGVTYVPGYSLPVLCTGDNPADMFIDQQSYEPKGQPTATITLASGDPKIFSVVVFDNTPAASPSALGYRNMFVRATPAKAGRFQASVKVTGGGKSPNTPVLYGANVTIVAKP